MESKAETILKKALGEDCSLEENKDFLDSLEAAVKFFEVCEDLKLRPLPILSTYLLNTPPKDKKIKDIMDVADLLDQEGLALINLAFLQHFTGCDQKDLSVNPGLDMGLDDKSPRLMLEFNFKLKPDLSI